MQRGCHEGQAAPPPPAFSTTFSASSAPPNHHAIRHVATTPDRRGSRRCTPESCRTMVPGGRTMPTPWRRQPAPSLAHEGTCSPRRRRQQPGFDRPHPRAAAGGGERGGEGGGGGGIRVPPAATRGREGDERGSKMSTSFLILIAVVLYANQIKSAEHG
jgi:hypothetical protein